MPQQKSGPRALKRETGTITRHPGPPDMRIHAPAA
jgi:hypothetical protein